MSNNAREIPYVRIAAEGAVVVASILLAFAIDAWWTERLERKVERKEAEARGEYDTGQRYYDHWLTALERVVVDKNLAGWEDLSNESETIREHDHHNREHQLQGEH